MTEDDARALEQRLNALPWPNNVHYEAVQSAEQLDLITGDQPSRFGGWYVRRVTERRTGLARFAP